MFRLHTYNCHKFRPRSEQIGNIQCMSCVNHFVQQRLHLYRVLLVLEIQMQIYLRLLSPMQVLRLAIFDIDPVIDIFRNFQSLPYYIWQLPRSQYYRTCGSEGFSLEPILLGIKNLMQAFPRFMCPTPAYA
jgi:hypothetical protein